MDRLLSAENLAGEVNRWCDEHDVVPASGQAGERLTERNVRYYRTLGVLDPPALGGAQGFGEKHRLQLIALRLLQAQGLPLSRIRELLFGRSLQELKRIEQHGVAELKAARVTAFRAPTVEESWRVTPLDDEFMIVSRRGRALPQDLRDRLLEVLRPNLPSTPGRTDRKGN